MSSIKIKDTAVRMKNGYFSLTDIAKTTRRPTDEILRGWLRNSDTLLFLEEWELLHNDAFNPVQMDGIKLKAMKRSEHISAKKYISETNAIGIRTNSGRYGGTYAHIEIALDFAAWVNPKFKVWLFKEWMRMKNKEVGKRNLEWHVEMLSRNADETQVLLETLMESIKKIKGE